jgi:hypothetical protein
MHFVGVYIRRNLLEPVLLVIEQEFYKSSYPLSLPPYKNLGSNTLLACDINLHIPVDSTLV